MAELDVGHYRNANAIYPEEGPFKGRPFKKFKPFRTKKKVKGGRKLVLIRIGPDAVEAIDGYLKERERNEDPLRHDEPLFVKRNGERFSANTLTSQFIRLSNYLDEKERGVISAYSLRKFHNNALPAAGFPGKWVYKLVGRKIPDSTANYTMPQLLKFLGNDEDALSEAYIVAYHGLKIFETADEKYNELLDELKKREMALKERDSAHAREVEDLRRKMEVQAQGRDVELLKINKKYTDLVEHLKSIGVIKEVRKTVTADAVLRDDRDRSKEENGERAHQE